MPIYKQVRTLERGLAVLEAVNSLPRATVENVAGAVRLPWSTVFRLLETLETLGYVRRGEDKKTFRPTVKVRSLSDGFDASAWIGGASSAVIRELTKELIWPVDVMIFENDRMVILDTTHQVSPMSIDRNMTGKHLPMLASAAGRAYLAFTSDQERELILERLARGGDKSAELARNKPAVAKFLAQVRRDRCGTRERGLMPHTSSIAVPVGSDGRVLACLTVIWIATAFDVAEGIRRYRSRLEAAATRILEAAEGSDPQASVSPHDPDAP